MNKKKSLYDQKIKKTLLWVANIIFSVSNAVFIYRGLFTRLWADDYCFSGIYVEYGFLGGLAHLYNHISNRFSAYLFSALTDWISWQSIRFIIPLVIPALLAGLIIFFRKIFIVASKREQWLTYLLFGQIVLFFTLLQAPNLDQGVYWRSGMSHYFLPLIPYVFLVKWALFPDKIRKWHIVPIFLLAFLSAGLSESYASLQAATAVLILLRNVVFPGRKERLGLEISIIILFASLIAVGIMAAAPGNQRRLVVVQRIPDIQSFVFLSFKYAADFIWYSLRGFWLPNFILLGISFFLSFLFLRNNGGDKAMRWELAEIFSLLIFGYLLVVSITAPTVFVMTAYPENRVLMLARFVMVGITALLGMSAGNLLRNVWIENRTFRFVSFIFLIAFSLYPLRTLPAIHADLVQAQKRAQAWDERHQEIMMQIAEGKGHLVVTALDAFSEIAEMSEAPPFWVNRCAAQYYGVESIAAIEGLHD